MSRNFQADLQKGLLGQQLFAKLFAGASHIDGKRGDLSCNGEKVELKVDFYSMLRTPNFFMERYSSLDVLSPGGPWQAKAHGCPWFVYFFATELHGFVWQTEALVAQLEKIEGKLKPFNVQNKNWVTMGYRVPRGALRSEVEFNSKGVINATDAGHRLIDNWGFKPLGRP